MRRLAFRAAPPPTPPISTRVGEPQLRAKSGCRACQSISEAGFRPGSPPLAAGERSGARLRGVDRFRDRLPPISAAPASIAKMRASVAPAPRKISVAPPPISSRQGATVCQSRLDFIGAAGQRPAKSAERQQAGPPGRRAIRRPRQNRAGGSLTRFKRIAGKAVDLFHGARDASGQPLAAQSPPGPLPRRGFVTPSCCACRARCRGSS